MKIRLHEIELGVKDVSNSHKFYSTVLGLQTAVENSDLKVLESGNKGLDFNISTHIHPKTMVISFLTDDLLEVMKKLQKENIDYRSPVESHLGMRSIEFMDPDGNLIRVNQPGKNSPAWLSG